MSLTAQRSAIERGGTISEAKICLRTCTRSARVRALDLAAVSVAQPQPPDIPFQSDTSLTCSCSIEIYNALVWTRIFLYSTIAKASPHAIRDILLQRLFPHVRTTASINNLPLSTIDPYKCMVMETSAGGARNIVENFSSRNRTALVKRIVAGATPDQNGSLDESKWIHKHPFQGNDGRQEREADLQNACLVVAVDHFPLLANTTSFRTFCSGEATNGDILALPYTYNIKADSRPL